MLNYDARASKFLIQLFFVCDAFCCVINVTGYLCVSNLETLLIYSIPRPGKSF